jgi:hypothetical protein
VEHSVRLLTTAYRDLSGVLGSLSDAEAWEPTGCAGWSVVDLGFHLLSDARRCLVALNTPADGPADTDAVDYWRAWRHPDRGERARWPAGDRRALRGDVGRGAGGGGSGGSR